MPAFAEGTLLDGRYRVIRGLGSGGMASVLLCQDERLGRQVAVKRLHADSPADVERRFVREARIGALLNHPNLVSVYDTATDAEGVLIVMEYVEGDALSRLLKPGPLRPERVALMLRDLGAALDHVHAHGVVHRDVKPANVLLRKDGVTKLADLGIATASDQTRITSSGMVLGTATYMAPEQLEGKETSPATDIYAMSVVAYEALTGRRARPGRTPMEIAHQVATSPPPDLRERMPDASLQAAELLQRAMARDPAERPSSAGELSTRLARALEAPASTEEPATEPMRSAPVRAAAAPPPTRRPPASRSRRPPQKRPWGAIALASILLVLTTAVVIGAVLSSGDGEGSQSASRQAQGDGQGDGQEAKKQKKRKKKESSEQAQPAPPPEEPAPAPEEDAPAPEEDAPAEETPTLDPTRGAELNDQGFQLMQQGNYDGAVPLLQQAVESFPEDSTDINYAYALFNLGKSLNRSGRSAEAIPYLEKRLEFADQRETVQEELDLARENAG